VFHWIVDVIGVVQDMGYCQLQEGTGKKLQVNFTFRDLSDITLNCTLWESYAGKFIQYNNDRKEHGPVIVLIKYGKVKEEGLEHVDLLYKLIIVICVFIFYVFICYFFLMSLANISGRFPLSISNTYSFTKLFINEDIPEINQFREMSVIKPCINVTYLLM